LARIFALLLVALGATYWFLSRGPFSLFAEYRADVRALTATPPPFNPVADADLAALPPPVQKYLRACGVPGQPRVTNFRASMHGRIRGGPNDAWMPFRAEQVNALPERARLFYLTASMTGLPVQGYHRYVGTEATMRIKAVALVPVVSAAGPEMTRSETVTLLNDMFMFAPAALIDAAISWTPVDAHTVVATFTNAGHTVQARASFGDSGQLLDFVSDDRYQLSPDGKTATLLRWSTPVTSYRRFGAMQLPAGGEGRWHDPRGDYAYIELTVDDVEYNVRAQ
jgi:hypothetical protein